ncbi:MAG: TIGR00366 family protein, partial [Maribacter sp.]
MLIKLGDRLSHIFLKYMPDAFVFALILTLVVFFGAFFWMHTSPLEIIKSWYNGFFDLLSFGMQIVLIIITGFSIALSPVVKKAIDLITRYINTPRQVYFLVTIIGMLLCLISFGWIVITAVLARELAMRIKGINYPFLIACVYFSMNSWVLGLSSSIPLLLNTEKNYLIEAEILTHT